GKPHAVLGDTHHHCRLVLGIAPVGLHHTLLSTPPPPVARIPSRTHYTARGSSGWCTGPHARGQTGRWLPCDGGDRVPPATNPRPPAAGSWAHGYASRRR